MLRRLLILVLLGVATVGAGADQTRPGSVATAGVRDSSGLFLPGGATASELQTRYSSGAGLTRFQAFLDIFCRTNANGGHLDTFGTVFDGNEHLGVYIYAYFEFTYPVPNANYRDCASQSAIDTPLFGLLDEIVAAGAPGTWAPRQTAACFALAAAGGRLGSPRIQRLIDYLQLNTDSWKGINPIGHAEGSRGRTVYTMSGYCFKGALGAEDAGAEGADARISKRSDYITGATGAQAMLNLSGAEGGYVEGWGYWMSELLQSIGFVDFYYHDAYRLYAGDASVWTANANKIHEYYPAVGRPQPGALQAAAVADVPHLSAPQRAADLGHHDGFGGQLSRDGAVRRRLPRQSRTGLCLVEPGDGVAGAVAVRGNVLPELRAAGIGGSSQHVQSDDAVGPVDQSHRLSHRGRRAIAVGGWPAEEPVLLRTANVSSAMRGATTARVRW